MTALGARPALNLSMVIGATVTWWSCSSMTLLMVLLMYLFSLQATVLLALLQPAPETYELFDDILLLSEGMTDASPWTSFARLFCTIVPVKGWSNCRRQRHTGHDLRPLLVCRTHCLPWTSRGSNALLQQHGKSLLCTTCTVVQVHQYRASFCQASVVEAVSPYLVCHKAIAL